MLLYLRRNLKVSWKVKTTPLLFYTPDPHDLRNLSPNVTYIFNVSLHSDKHLRQYKYATLSFMAAILGKLRKDKMVDNMQSTSKDSIMRLDTLYMCNILDLPPSQSPTRMSSLSQSAK